MISLFKTPEVDRRKVDDFVKWFLDNGDRIRQSVDNSASDRNNMLAILEEVEIQLGKVYCDGYKGRIEFDYGGKDDDWELNLYHKNKPFLINAVKMIADTINSSDSGIWIVNTGR